MDKMIMGAIIGTAVGSAIGASMAPQKGSETRKMIKERSEDLSKEVKEVGELTKETTKGLFTLFKNLLFGRKKKKKQAPPLDGMKKIPHEGEALPTDYADRDTTQ